MSDTTNISWTDATFNPWIGCAKVHEGCTHCYAESFAKRYGKATWGPNGTRVKTSEANWRKPLKWNREAEKAGVRRKVFCSSLADVFEDWTGPIHDHQGRPLFTINGEELFTEHDYPECRAATMSDVRRDLFKLIDQTPCLDWQLLTKRPENIQRFWPTVHGENARLNWQATEPCPAMPSHPKKWRRNVWLGTSVSNQATADTMVPRLLECRDLSPVLFLSMEPLLGPVNLGDLAWMQHDMVIPHFDGDGQFIGDEHGSQYQTLIDWVIVGGESGHGARPMHPDWARGIRDECQAAGAAFFFKQWGEWIPRHSEPMKDIPILPLMDDGKHGVFDDTGNWRLNEGEFSRYENLTGQAMYRVGKQAAGDLLDGIEWKQFPQTENA